MSTRQNCRQMSGLGFIWFITSTTHQQKILSKQLVFRINMLGQPFGDSKEKGWSNRYPTRLSHAAIFGNRLPNTVRDHRLLWATDVSDSSYWFESFAVCLAGLLAQEPYWSTGVFGNLWVTDYDNTHPDNWQTVCHRLFGIERRTDSG